MLPEDEQQKILAAVPNAVDRLISAVNKETPRSMVEAANTIVDLFIHIDSANTARAIEAEIQRRAQEHEE